MIDLRKSVAADTCSNGIMIVVSYDDGIGKIVHCHRMGILKDSQDRWSHSRSEEDKSKEKPITKRERERCDDL